MAPALSPRPGRIRRSIPGSSGMWILLLACVCSGWWTSHPNATSERPERHLQALRRRPERATELPGVLPASFDRCRSTTEMESRRSMARGRAKPVRRATALAVKEIADVRHGRFERMLSGLTAIGRGGDDGRDLLRARQGELRPTLDVGADRRRADRRCGAASPAGPATGWRRPCCPWHRRSSSPTASRARCCTRRASATSPGGWKEFRYNMEMGPPLLAPLLVTLVGGMGLLAAVLRREP